VIGAPRNAVVVEGVKMDDGIEGIMRIKLEE
jgi:hypothetical protein